MTDTSYAGKAAPRGATYERVGPKPVFIAARDIPASKNPPTGEELYCCLMKTVKGENIAGIQRIGSLWRIYLSEHDERVKVIVNGLCLRGVNVPVHDMNPFTKARDEHMTRVMIKDVPLSVGDDLIRATLEGMKCKIRGEIVRQQLRVNGQLTNCLNGDRVAYIDPPSQPLPRFLVIANVFRARAFHVGQPDERQETRTVICSRCLERGHHASTCSNPVKCRTCKGTGHLSHSCPGNTSQQSHGNADNRAPPPTKDPADESPANNTPLHESSAPLRNVARGSQDDVGKSTAGRKTRQIDISDFLRSKDTVAAASSAQQLKETHQRASDVDGASYYSTTHDGEDDFTSCCSISSDEEHSPLSPETPTPDKHKQGKKSTKRKLKGKKQAKKQNAKENMKRMNETE